MDSNIVKAAAVALVMVFGPAMADDVPLDPAIGAQPMSETELATVQGGVFDTCILCALSNVATVGQANVSALSALVAQSNGSTVVQYNN